jgi:hypothetical protein
VTIICGCVATAYVALRVAGVAGAKLVEKTGDSAELLAMATRAPWTGDFLAAGKPWTVPLVYKVVGAGQVIHAQVAISAVCWLALAAVVATQVRRRYLAIAAFTAVLAFSLSIWVTEWDHQALTESISVSLGALVVAAWLVYLRFPRALVAVGLSAVTLVWVFARDTNAYVLLLAVPVIAVWTFKTHRFRRGTAVALIASCAIAAASLVVANAAHSCVTGTKFVSRGEARAHSGYCTRRWYTLVNTIAIRVLPDRDASAYFRRHGMPVPPLLAASSGKTAAWYAPVYFAPSMQGFKRWLDRSGRSTYVDYLWSHPDDVTPPGRGVAALLAPRYGRRLTPDRVAEPSLAEQRFGARRLLPSFADDIAFAPTPLALAIEALVALSLLAAALVRRLHVQPAVWVAAFLVASAPFHALVVWHGDAADIPRHSLLVQVFLRLGLLLIAVFAIDALGSERPVTRNGGHVPEGPR